MAESNQTKQSAYARWRSAVALFLVCGSTVAGFGGIGVRLGQAAAVRPLMRAPGGATAKQSRTVLSCLTRVGLAHVSAGSPVLWSAWYTVAGDFVYVYMYPSKSAATSRARSMSAEEVAPAGQYLVVEPTARYSGSPVPEVADCLLGKPFHKPQPTKHKGTFSF